MLFSRAIRLRNLQVGERLAMVPYADLINHSAFSMAYIDARETGDWLFKNGEEEIILYADRGYRQMEQVRVYIGCIIFEIELSFHSRTVRYTINSLLLLVVSLLFDRFTYLMDKNQMPNFSSSMDSHLNVTLTTLWMSLFPSLLAPPLLPLPMKALRRTRWLKKRWISWRVLEENRLLISPVTQTDTLWKCWNIFV